MGDIRAHRPVMVIVAAFSRYDAALDWARQTCSDAWGPVTRESPRFTFDETTFYERAMGAGLKKTFFVFAHLADPGELPDWKHQTNQWEQQFAATHDFPEQRPLNLDPGYVTEAKLVLASTKDRDHRIYLRRGIFAENTLFFHGGHWKTRPWTYPDYRRVDYHEFLTACRVDLRQRYAEERRRKRGVRG